MEMMNVLHMNGGTGAASYANNSLIQKKVILLTQPITKEAVTDLHTSLHSKLECLKIADIGCSSGPNTFLAVSQVIKTVEKSRKKMGLISSQEIQIYLNDLPGNDFNLIFRSLPRFQEQLREDLGPDVGPFFINGVPGSFYGRLFPKNSLHFVHSSYSLMWLSQVPKGAEKNKGNIILGSTSPESVVRAYSEQFEKDFIKFLECRSMEVVDGGYMVLTILGRISEDPCSKEGCLIWQLLGKALQDMVSEGMIKEEKLHSFNIPQYTPCPAELRLMIEKEGSFKIDRLEASSLNWDLYKDDSCLSAGTEDSGYIVTNCVRAAIEPLLVDHFGQGIIEQVFYRYRDYISDSMSNQDQEFINVTVSVTKKVEMKHKKWI